MWNRNKEQQEVNGIINSIIAGLIFIFAGYIFLAKKYPRTILGASAAILIAIASLSLIESHEKKKWMELNHSLQYKYTDDPTTLIKNERATEIFNKKFKRTDLIKTGDIIKITTPHLAESGLQKGKYRCFGMIYRAGEGLSHGIDFGKYSPCKEKLGDNDATQIFISTNQNNEAGDKFSILSKTGSISDQRITQVAESLNSVRLINKSNRDDWKYLNLEQVVMYTAHRPSNVANNVELLK